jgi:hypothetical protein
MYYFELLQTNNNTFNDIGTKNLIKLYNITCACIFTQTYIFQTKPPFYFWKKITLYAQI